MSHIGVVFSILLYLSISTEGQLPKETVWGDIKNHVRLFGHTMANFLGIHA